MAVEPDSFGFVHIVVFEQAQLWLLAQKNDVSQGAFGINVVENVLNVAKVMMALH